MTNFRTRAVKMAAVRGRFRKPVAHFSSEEITSFLFSNESVSDVDSDDFSESLASQSHRSEEFVDQSPSPIATEDETGVSCNDISTMNDSVLDVSLLEYMETSNLSLSPQIAHLPSVSNEDSSDESDDVEDHNASFFELDVSGTSSSSSASSNDSISTDDESIDSVPTVAASTVYVGNRRGRGRGIRRSRGRGRGAGRGKGQAIGHGGTTQALAERNTIPACAVSIATTDNTFVNPLPFGPIREPGPHLPTTMEDPTGLDMFQLFFDDSVVERLVRCTNEYAELKKDEKKYMYRRFKLETLTVQEMRRFLGILILLGINKVRNIRQVWNPRNAQVMSTLFRLMTRHRFEAIASFLHVVSLDEEQELANDPLKKIKPLHNYIKRKCFKLYQPLREVSIDERMVKNKGRHRFGQYMKSKPIKWGFKYWVLADPTGYSVDFDLYLGSAESHSENGLAYDVVQKLISPLVYQRYFLFCDNFYSSPKLFCDLLQEEVYCTGTVSINRRELPSDVKGLKEAMGRRDITRGSGYWVKEPYSEVSYCCWKDSKPVLVMSTCYPGHSHSRRRVKESTGNSHTTDVPIPVSIQQYNRFMGGVDKSDQYLSYHNVNRKTDKYWKTPFFHLVDIALTNAFLLYNWLRMQAGLKRISENVFRDTLVQQTIDKYPILPPVAPSPLPSSFQIGHGSKPTTSRARCAACQRRSARPCPDCPSTPHLCQTLHRDCHDLWHSSNFAHIRQAWIMRHHRSTHTTDSDKQAPLAKRGRPTGSRNFHKRRGSYKHN